MTHRFDVAHDPAVAARWCALAEQRLEYLSELFKNGRWRRYYSHAAFLENIKEAKAVVAHWRALSMPGDVAERPTPDPEPGFGPNLGAAVPSESDLVAANEVAAAVEAPAARTPDLLDEEIASAKDVVQDRYSLLRNLSL